MNQASGTVGNGSEMNAVVRNDWAMLVDPGWNPESVDEAPPPHVMAGGWRLDENGDPGLFEANPEYVPLMEGGATDPVDAVLRLIARGDVTADALIPTLRNSYVQLAVTPDRNQLLVGPAPDDAQCVAVVTAGLHRKNVSHESWLETTVDDLVEFIPDGVDILLNPGSPFRFRLLTEAVRLCCAEDPENVKRMD
ncbi:type VII secretion system-associated protein [Lentzea alba]|uniref:type VII secretion system-associated protein n=1 Tax=Lentzea alba TaxID=2714351 RepID=UPI0039BF0552